MTQSLRSPSCVFCHEVEVGCEPLLIEEHPYPSFHCLSIAFLFFGFPFSLSTPLDHADGPFFRHIEQPVLLDTRLNTAFHRVGSTSFLKYKVHNINAYFKERRASCNQSLFVKCISEKTWHNAR